MRTNRFKRYIPKQFRESENHEEREKQEGFVQRKFREYKERNTPERRQARIANLELEAREQQLKTQIHMIKQKRYPKMISGGMSGYSSGKRITKRPSLSSLDIDPHYSRPQDYLSAPKQSHDFSGFDRAWGLVGSQDKVRKQVRKKPQNPWSGMDSLFGAGP